MNIATIIPHWWELDVRTADYRVIGWKLGGVRQYSMHFAKYGCLYFSILYLQFTDSIGKERSCGFESFASCT